jgi:hypothetical protein
MAAKSSRVAVALAALALLAACTSAISVHGMSISGNDARNNCFRERMLVDCRFSLMLSVIVTPPGLRLRGGGAVAEKIVRTLSVEQMNTIIVSKKNRMKETLSDYMRGLAIDNPEMRELEAIFTGIQVNEGLILSF